MSLVCDLSTIVFESDLAGSAPIALAPPLTIQRQSVKLLIRICYSCQPIGHAVERSRRDQPIKDQHHRHCTVVHLGSCGTVTIDDVTHLEHFQQAI